MILHGQVTCRDTGLPVRPEIWRREDSWNRYRVGIGLTEDGWYDYDIIDDIDTELQDTGLPEWICRACHRDNIDPEAHWRLPGQPEPVPDIRTPAATHGGKL